MTVAVIGAGLAGLAAAEALARVGHEVVVLEARDRVGGRVFSSRLPNGSVVEHGAEFVLPEDDALRANAARLGLELADRGMFYGDREPRGVPLSLERLREAAAIVSAALEALPDGGHALDAASFLDALDLTPAARGAIRARAEVSCAAPADRFAAAELAGVAAASRTPCPSVRGGNQQLALRLAERLGASVRLGTPVESVRWRDGAVRVIFGCGEVEAHRVVIAVPAAVISTIEFDPPLPAPLTAAYAQVEVGHAAKLFVPLSRPAPPSAVLSVPERYWTWTATRGDGLEPVVHAFAGSAPALAALDVAQGPERWLASLARLRPDLDLECGGAVLSTWDDDPWARGAYSCATPPEEAWAPVGPLHVCGEHTAGRFAALMGGALRSGLRVAEEIGQPTD